MFSRVYFSPIRYPNKVCSSVLKFPKFLRLLNPFLDTNVEFVFQKEAISLDENFGFWSLPLWTLEHLELWNMIKVQTMVSIGGYAFYGTQHARRGVQHGNC
jgi:hypothetical protein